jgi:phytoene dehydrogenase-like protein
LVRRYAAAQSRHRQLRAGAIPDPLATERALQTSGWRDSVANTIIIIGGGIAGLSAGCYARLNGYQTRIFERHTLPGGLCTSWYRDEFTFDGCIHWLVGSRPGSPMNQIWRELGATGARGIVDHEEYMRLQDRDGRVLVVYTDLGRLERHMKELSPSDSRDIEMLCGTAQKFLQLARSTGEPVGQSGILSRTISALRMLSLLKEFRRFASMPVTEFAARFQDPFLRRVLALIFDFPGFPMAALLMTLAFMHDHNAGYPIGGSLAFARAIERRYLELGGEIRYGARVEKILVDGSMASGIRLADGSEQHADIVISAADGHTTIFEMLDGKYADDTFRSYYSDLPIFRPIVQVSLGVNRDFSAEPHSLRFELPEPTVIAGETRDWITVRHMCYDPTMAPPGKSVLIVMLQSDYQYWKELHKQPSSYEAEKQAAVKQVIGCLERKYPGIAKQVETANVATPITWHRYTGNWQGSIEGWLITPKTFEILTGKGMSKTLPGLKSFYMTGQWVEPGGGLPTVAIAARRLIRAICKSDRRPFVTSTPSNL